MFFAILERVQGLLRRLRFDVLILWTLLHYVLWWVVILATEEKGSKITEPIQYLYFWATTVLTIGYGDLSPQSEMSRLFAAPFQFTGVLLFAAWLGKAGLYIGEATSKKRRGLMPTKAKGHVLILGDYHETEIGALLANALHDCADDGIVPSAVGCFRNTDERNPFEGMNTSRFSGVMPEYIKATAGSFSLQVLEDANALRASAIYVRTEDDTTAVGIVAALTRLRVGCPVVVMLRDQQSEQLLPHSALDVRVVVPVQAHLAAREAADPGVGAMISDILDVTSGDGVYSLLVSCTREDLTYGEAVAVLRALHGNGILLLGFARKSNEGHLVPWVRPQSETMLRDGDRLIYIADKDLSAAQEAAFTQALLGTPLVAA